MSSYKLTYFREDGGRYYSEGILEFDGLFDSAVNYVRHLLKVRELPGLVSGHSYYSVILQDIHGLPHLIK